MSGFLHQRQLLITWPAFSALQSVSNGPLVHFPQGDLVEVSIDDDLAARVAQIHPDPSEAILMLVARWNGVRPH